MELLNPIVVGGLGSLPNRMVLASLTRARNTEDGVPTEIMGDYYVQRATAGMMLSEATAISKEGFGWYRGPGIFSPEQIAGWKKVTDRVRAANGTILCQLWHMGRTTHSAFFNIQPVSASAVKANGETYIAGGQKVAYETPRALSTEEIPRLVQDYANAARNAMDAGFHGVEVHAANGYLIDQFLQSKVNQRTDQYGGNVENRCRLLAEVLDAVCAIVPANKVGVKLSPNGVFGDVGSPDFVEQWTAAIELCARKGLAYIQIMDGVAFGFHQLGEPFTAKMAVDAVARVQGPTRSTKVIANCGYTLETGREALKNGSADMIAYGRPWIANPDLVARFKEGSPLVESEMADWYPQHGLPRNYVTYPDRLGSTAPYKAVEEADASQVQAVIS